MTLSALDQVAAQLRRRVATGGARLRYGVPGLWLDPDGLVAERPVLPEAFFLGRIQAILAASQSASAGLVSNQAGPGEWGRDAVAYNLFVRAGAAWDHDGDGEISVEPSADGWRETGTFLKAITLLPFIRSLGCNTIHLLPVTAIGRDGHKGNLGSPFAIRDPYTVEPTLAEPALGLGAEVEFAAFVEAAHRLGLRVVTEFVFRTAAKDATWAGQHPEWFYWLRADVPDRAPGQMDAIAYGAPIFAAHELEQIYRQVATGLYAGMLPPHEVYRRMFAPPPPRDTVHLVGGQWRGLAVDPATGHSVTVRIPGAFSDWTPDSEQPPWTDVTYLRLYDHPDFNYIAYNTVRMYDTRLARPENAVGPLWDKIVEVIPHWQQSFGIDGVMIDMGHALPPALKQRIVTRAREVNSDFALWAEDFQLKPTSRAEGYNVVVGPFMQTVRDRERFAGWLRELAATGVPVPFMAMPENHNCPRAATWPGGLTYALYAATLGAFLPAVPYIHGGQELGETHPINTGFDFTLEELARLPADVLPLFSAAAYGWTRQANLVGPLRQMLAARARHAALLTDPAAESIRLIETDNPRAIAFERGRPGGQRLLVVANSDMATAQEAVTVSGPRLSLAPGEVVLSA